MTLDIDATQAGSVTIIGLGPQNLTLDANQKCRVLTVSGETTVANLGGLTITNGSVANKYGGGIYKSAGTLTITNSVISGNTASHSADSYGGGIYNNSGTLKITNST
ncbi:MAG: hypothetical protein IJK97_11125, partial [Thermoguttaceae bacterium]|nr:hypothetical protein [Thermoguttaceae bacterium]